MTGELRAGGVYVVHLGAPLRILQAANNRPGWAQALVRAAVEQHSVALEYQGSGIGWHDNELVYMVRVRVLRPDEAPIPVEQAGVAIPVAVLGVLIAGALALMAVEIRRTIELIPPDDRGGIAAGLGDAGRAFLNMTLIAAGVVGLAALERYGVLRGG